MWPSSPQWSPDSQVNSSDVAFLASTVMPLQAPPSEQVTSQRDSGAQLNTAFWQEFIPSQVSLLLPSTVMPVQASLSEQVTSHSESAAAGVPGPRGHMIWASWPQKLLFSSHVNVSDAAFLASTVMPLQA